jgi:hypothetical protein
MYHSSERPARMLSWPPMALNPYAPQLGGRDALAVMGATPGRLRQLVDAIGEGGLTTPRAAGKWSPRDILCHLADCEVVFSFRLRQALAEDNPVVLAFNQEDWAAPYSNQDAAAALAAFSAMRAWNLSLVNAVPQAARERRLTHPERGEMTFQTVLETMGGHDLNHLAQLEEVASRRQG